MATVAHLEERMLFCSECENLLYPESDENKNLIWRCRACQNVETHDDANLVHQLALKREIGGSKELQLLAQFANDPTVHRSQDHPCPECGKSDIAYFVNPLEQPTEDMSLFYVCTDCKYVWKGLKEGKKQ